MVNEINEGFKLLVKKHVGIPIQAAKVESYDSEKQTVDVVVDNITLYSVNLMPADSENYCLIVPKVGSWVYIGEVGSGVYTVLQSSEIDKVLIKIGTTELNIDTEGVEIKRGVNSLKTVLDQTFTELTTSFTAISAVIPIANLAQYNLLKTKIDSILK